MLLHDSHAAQASKKQIQDVLNVSQFLGFIVYHSNPLLKKHNVELFSKTKKNKDQSISCIKVPQVLLFCPAQNMT